MTQDSYAYADRVEGKIKLSVNITRNTAEHKYEFSKDMPLAELFEYMQVTIPMKSTKNMTIILNVKGEAQ